MLQGCIPHAPLIAEPIAGWFAIQRRGDASRRRAARTCPGHTGLDFLRRINFSLRGWLEAVAVRSHLHVGLRNLTLPFSVSSAKALTGRKC